MTSASGTFTSCGFGQPFSLQFTCTGTGCSLLDDFPGTTCTNNGTTLSCTNGVECPGSNYTTTFNVDQPLNAVVQSMQIFLSDECTQFDVTNNGTQSGVLVQSLPIANCTPETSSASSSSSSLLSSTSSTTVATTTSSTSSNVSSSTSVGTMSSSTSCSSSSGSSINSPSSSSTTCNSALSSSITKGTSATSASMKTIVIVSSGVTLTITVPCSEGSEGTPQTSVPGVKTYSINTASGPQALFASKPSGTVSISGTGTPVLGYAATDTTAGNGRPTSSSVVATSNGPAQPVFTSSASSYRKRPNLNIYSLILVLFAFLHLATALDITPAANLTHRAISAPLLTPGTTPNPLLSNTLSQRSEGSLGKQFTDILSDWVAGKITTPSLGETLAAEIYSAICSHFAGAVVTAGAFPELAAALEYLSLVFDTIALPTGPEGWLLAFTFAVMVNVIVDELFPMISAMADQACDAAKEAVLCSTHFEDDALNCGYCGNQCPSGSCINSACVSNTCTGETCETFTECGPGGTCVCASTAEGTGFCVDGSTPCTGLQTCGTSSDCPAGIVCAVGACCGVNVCVGATTCGGANATSAAKFLFRRDFDGLTFGHLY